MGSFELSARPVAAPRAAAVEPLMVALAAAHALVLCLLPGAPVIALGVWWNSNTISHNFIHRPFFRSRTVNRALAAYLSALLGIPQSLWRDRHLAHHAGVAPRIRMTAELAVQLALVLGVWATLGALAPRYFFTAYLPGYLAGLALCALQGHYEHARGVTSHYGRLYNFLTFNDGHHAEHHANPAARWSSLPQRLERGAAFSVWPAPLRWLESVSLEGLERLALHSGPLRRFLLRTHKRALARLLREAGPIERIVIVGGGIFPRTAIIMRDLAPAAHIVVIDSNAANLAAARIWLAGDLANIDFVHALYIPGSCVSCDLLVIPLALRGDRAAVYSRSRAPVVAVHDWIWRKRGTSSVVSPLLLKRVNLVRP